MLIRKTIPLLTGMTFLGLTCAAVHAAPIPDAPSDLRGFPQQKSKGPELTNEAGPIEYDLVRNVARAKGEVLLVHEGLSVQAAEAEYDKAQGQVSAMGNVRANFGGVRLVTQAVRYNEKTGMVEMGESRAGMASTGSDAGLAGGVRMEVGSLGGIQQAMVVDDAVIYAGEPDWLALNAKVGRVKISDTEGGKLVRVEDMWMRVGKVPFFYLPSYSYDTSGAGPSLRLQAGASGRLGGHISATYLMPVNDSLRVGPEVGLFTKRGLLIGPAAEWSWGDPDEDYYGKGFLSSGWIQDSGDTDEDIWGREIDDSRSFVELGHQQQVDRNWDLVSRVSYWSDSEVVRDFNEDRYADNPMPDNFVEATRRGEKMVFSVTAAPDINQFDLGVQRLPEVHFDMLPSLCPNDDFYHAFHSSVALMELDQDDVPLRPGMGAGFYDRQATRVDALYSLFRPIDLSPWSRLTPIAGLRLTHWSSQEWGQIEPADYSRFMGELGFDWQMEASQSWNYRNRTWGIDGLKHIVRPVVQYRYMPGGAVGNGDVVPLDRELPVVGMAPMDLADMRYVDTLSDMNQLRLGVENQLLTRDTDYGSRSLAELNFYQDLRFSDYTVSTPFDAFHTQLVLSPADWISLDYANLIDPSGLRFAGQQFGVTVRDGDVWSLSLTSALIRYVDEYRNPVDYDRLEDFANVYFLTWRYRFNQIWELRTSFGFDADEKTLYRQDYTLSHRLSNSWIAEYRVYIRRNDERAGSTGVRLGLKYVGF